MARIIKKGKPKTQNPNIQFRSFLLNNKFSSINKKKNGAFVIEKPWNDETLEFVIPTKADKLSSILNTLYLPPRFSALYHKTNKSLEFIYTSFPIREELKKRSFNFNFEGRNYKCEFNKSSQELLDLADVFQPISPRTATNYRNLDDYKRVASLKNLKNKKIQLDNFQPISFWINGLDWDEGKSIEIARHLNFFMTYFDKQTPFIEIHEDEFPAKEYKYKRRDLLFGDFPKDIVGKPINSNLLLWWDAAKSAPNPFLSYLYYYQILEYAAYYHLQNNEEEQLNNIITSPDILFNKEKTISRILDIMATIQGNDEHKISQVLRRYVDPGIIWREVENFKDYFSKEITFDGGVTIPSLMSPDCVNETFKTQWQTMLPWITNIRNYIAHARERRSSTAIIPSKKNRNLIYPWVAVISSAANQVMIHQ